MCLVDYSSDVPARRRISRVSAVRVSIHTQLAYSRTAFWDVCSLVEVFWKNIQESIPTLAKIVELKQAKTAELTATTCSNRDSQPLKTARNSHGFAS